MAVETANFQLVMPAMGESVSEGTILEWHRHEGEAVAADETIVEISTDKVDAEVPAPIAGTLIKIHAVEGDTVQVGQLLAEIAPGGDGNGTAGAPAAPPAPGGAPPATIDIVTPTGGESVTEGTILEWSVKVGDTVASGDTVVEISTDKVDMELPAPAAGTITEILFAEGDTVTVGQVIARMSTDATSGAPAGALARRRGGVERGGACRHRACGRGCRSIASRPAGGRGGGDRPRGRARERTWRADYEIGRAGGGQ